MTTEYADTPFPGDYQPNQVDASATGFLNTFDAGLPSGFSPATSEHSSFATGFGPASADPSRPNTSAGPQPTNMDLVLGGPTSTPGMVSAPTGSFAHGHFHSHAAHHQHNHSFASGHSHSFSSASLPSLASSSTSFSLASQADPHPPPGSGGPVYVAAFPGNEYGHAHIMNPDGSKPPFSFGASPIIPPGATAPHGLGLGVGIGMPPTPISSISPTVFGRSPSTNAIPTFSPTGHMVGMGRTQHERNRSASRPTPYHVSSRSNSLSIRSDADEELRSIYSQSSAHSGYQSSWSNTPNMIVGDLGQMSLEHRRSSSTPFELPTMGTQLAGRHRARSFSLGRTSNSLDFLEADLELSGAATERETQVRADLASKAEQVRTLSPCQHGKARAVWAKRWLKLSYTPVNGFTVPRQGLYHSYTMSCQDFGLRPINSASFGKVVRSTFQGIRTRRLGVRGNSKYHYVSLRPAIATEAHRLNAYGDSSGQLHMAPHDGDMGADDLGGEQEVLTEDDTDDEEDDDLADLSENSITYSAASVHPFTRPRHSSGSGVPRSRSAPADNTILRSARPAYVRLQDQASIGAQSGGRPRPMSGRALPPFPQLPATADPQGQPFWARFGAHLELLARCINETAFDRFETNYRSFWETLTPETKQLCAQQPLSSMIVDAMALLLDHIVLSLVDKILLPISPTAHAALGVLATNFEKMTIEGLASLSPEISSPIVELAGHAAHLMTRFLDLHQITTAIGPILADADQLAAMRASWRMLDKGFIVRQCTLACECGESVVEPALSSFTHWLNSIGTDPNAHPIEQLASCVDGSTTRAESYLPSTTSARTLIPRAAYVTSQVMRLLTLRSDLSFGWFQLIKTWIDDYVALSFIRRSVFSRPGTPVFGTEDQSTQAPAVAQVFTSTPVDITMAAHGHGGRPSSGGGSVSSGNPGHPNLAIDTASANYHAVLPLDNAAITPRPAFPNQPSSAGIGPAPVIPGVTGGQAISAGANSTATFL